MRSKLLNSLSASFGQQIREQLLEMIQGLRANDRLPTEMELAKSFGVSRPTIHTVMSALRREGYIDRVPGRGTFVAQPDRRVMLGLDNPRRLGEIIIAYPDYFAFDIWQKIRAAEELAREQKIELLHLKMNRSTRYENVVDLARSRGVQPKGIVILPTTTTIDRKSLSALDALGIPVTLLAAMDRPALGRNIRVVCYDAFKAGYLAAMHLVTHNHRRLAYVQNEPWNTQSKLHYNGVKAALYERGFNLRDLARSPLGIEHWANAIESGYRFTADLLKNKPTGIIYRSLPGAIGALRAINEAGLRTPDDVSIVTQGEAGPEDDYRVPGLTSVVSDYTAWLSAAFDFITGGRNEEGQVMIDVRLVERQSVRTLDDADQPS